MRLFFLAQLKLQILCTINQSIIIVKTNMQAALAQKRQPLPCWNIADVLFETAAGARVGADVRHTLQRGLHDTSNTTLWQASSSPYYILNMTETDTHLMASGVFTGRIWVGWHQQDKTILDFNEEIHYVAAVASAGPQDRSPHHLITQFFTHRMLFLMLNQQRQSTDSDRVAVLCVTRHKMGHFGGVPQVNLLACYRKTRPNTRKAYIHQSKEMYNTK